MPRVSVIMSVYNAEKYVKEAIESILNQTYEDLEIIVFNDGSVDKSRSIIEGIKDSRLTFINSEINTGLINGLNTCISKSTGEYIACLDADDISYPQRIEKQVRYLEENTNIVLAGTMTDIWENGIIIKRDQVPIKTCNQIRFSLAFNNFVIAHSSFMIRKSILNEYCIRYEDYYTQDYHMQTRLLEVGEVACVDEILVTYRLHSQQSTAIHSRRKKLIEFDRARLWYLNRINISEEDKCVLKRAVLRKLRTAEDVKEFTEAFKRYAIKCGLDFLGKDLLCVKYIYRSIMESQYRCIGLFRGCIARLPKILLKDNFLSVKFLFTCIVARNKGFIESVYDESSI